MTSLFYKDQLPDWTDQTNATGTRPGYRLYVEENDGLIAVSLQPADKDEISSEDAYTATLTVAQAKALINGIQDAIRRAES